MQQKRAEACATMCSADGFVNAHRWVASAALAPRPAVDLIEEAGGQAGDVVLRRAFRERKSLGVREGFNFRPVMLVASCSV